MNYPKALLLATVCAFSLSTVTVKAADFTREHGEVPKRNVYFQVSKAPTPRLATMISFWDSELALQIKEHSPATLGNSSDFIREVARMSDVLGDTEEGKPLTLTEVEANFLLDHREPIVAAE